MNKKDLIERHAKKPHDIAHLKALYEAKTGRNYDEVQVQLKKGKKGCGQ